MGFCPDAAASRQLTEMRSLLHLILVCLAFTSPASASKGRLKPVIGDNLTCDHICDKVTNRRAQTLKLAAAILGSHPSVQ